jgi:acetyl-CoA carboxylase biotin carboxyl carrier protein
MIELRKLKQLIQLMKDNELSELDIRDKEEQVTLKRGGGGPVQYVPAATTPAAPPAAPAADVPAAEPSAADQGLVELTSPMVGTFYAASSPDAEPFVRVGATVDAEKVVCIIEAMKVFNEIKAEMSGTIEKVLVSNGQAVEFGQPMFLVKPH